MNSHREFKGRCAIIDGSPLYVFSDGELKGQYYHEGKTASLFRLINTQHPSPKKWALDFINARLLPGEQLADYHKKCNTAVPIKAIHDYLKSDGHLDQVQMRYEESQKNVHNLLKESCRKQYAIDPIGSYQTELALSCLDECQSKELEGMIWEKYKIGDFVVCIMEREVTPDYLSQLMAISDLVFTQVIQHLNKIGTKERKNRDFLCWWFKHLNQYAYQERVPQILDMIEKALSDHAWFVRIGAAKALSELAAQAEKESIPRILVMLEKALRHQDEYVSGYAVNASRSLKAHVEKENISQ